MKKGWQKVLLMATSLTLLGGLLPGVASEVSAAEATPPVLPTLQDLTASLRGTPEEKGGLLFYQNAVQYLRLIDSRGLLGPGRRLVVAEDQIRFARGGSMTQKVRRSGRRVNRTFGWLSVYVPVLKDGARSYDQVEFFFAADPQGVREPGQTKSSVVKPLKLLLHGVGSQGERYVKEIPLG